MLVMCLDDFLDDLVKAFGALLDVFELFSI